MEFALNHSFTASIHTDINFKSLLGPRIITAFMSIFFLCNFILFYFYLKPKSCLIVAVTLHFEMVVSAGKVADLQRVGIALRFGRILHITLS